MNVGKRFSNEVKQLSSKLVENRVNTINWKTKWEERVRCWRSSASGFLQSKYVPGGSRAEIESHNIIAVINARLLILRRGPSFLDKTHFLFDTRLSSGKLLIYNFSKSYFIVSFFGVYKRLKNKKNGKSSDNINFSFNI